MKRSRLHAVAIVDRERFYYALHDELFARVPHAGESIDAGGVPLQITNVVWARDGSAELIVKLPGGWGSKELHSAGWSLNR